MGEVRLRLAAWLLLPASGLAGCTGGDDGAGGLGPQPSGPQPSTWTGSPHALEDTPGPEAAGHPRVVGTVASGLAAPWGITFLPDGTALVGERDTTRVLAVPAGHGPPHEVGRVEGAAPQGEAGLLGVATSPSYDEDRLVYAYVSTEQDNRVVRMKYDGGRLGARSRC